MSGKVNQVVVSQQKKNLNDLDSFCKYCLTKYPHDKPMAKVDAATLLLLLNNKMTPDKAEYFRSQMSRASGREYKSDGMISMLSESLVNVFLSALKPEETDSGPRIRMRTLKRYLYEFEEQQQDLEEEIIKIKEQKGYITNSEHKEAIQDLDNDYINKITFLKSECEKSETRMKFLEEKLAFQEKESKERINNLQTQLYDRDKKIEESDD